MKTKAQVTIIHEESFGSKLNKAYYYEKQRRLLMTKCQSCKEQEGTFAGKDERGEIYLCDDCVEAELRLAYTIQKEDTNEN